MAELLRGIHQIKMCAWEQAFVAKVCSEFHHLAISDKHVQLVVPPEALAT